MLRYSKSIFAVSIVFLFISCGGNTRNESNSIIASPTASPEALQESSSYEILKVGSRYSDLTDELYQEQVDKDVELQNLEIEIQKNNVKSGELYGKNEAYINKSKQYYSSSTNHLSEISDSILRKKIESIIQKSNDKFEKNTSNINSLWKQIVKNNSSISDQHTVLKIMLTLPLIEKYQKDNIPNKKDFIDLKNNQKRLIKKTIKLNP